ncbi:MAG: recombination protein RecR [Ruminococcaceae bacterium]|nr:recombination protein RecR [Oscillospiraceae bacterium]
MDYFAPSLARLIDEFNKLPSIGKKSAQRLAFHLLNRSEKEVEQFAQAILEAKKNIRRCSQCFSLTDSEVCPICASTKRDRTIICVVEDAKSLIAIERTHEYKGLYHVLGGCISPMDGISPEDLTIKELLQRISTGEAKEVLIATGSSVEGEATAMYLAKLIKAFGVKVSRLAYGIPVGGDLEYADEVTLLRAIEGRREM